MFASPKLNSKYPHQAVPPNPDVYDSDMPTFTTDARMDKVPDLFASGPGHGEPSQSSGSGGGGAVEAVFWIKEVGKQWRIRGEAYVLAPDVEGPSEESSGVRTLKSRVGERLRVVDESQRDNWSWKKELDTQFMNLAPGMRGSFRNPPPGTPVKQPVPEGKELGQKVNDVGDELARNNFRVVIIRPEVVECVDMKDPATARRWRYTFVGNVGGEGVEDGWRKEELWP
jgi:pyridoxamine 5'-phosphate oxidase